jgi:chemotaxis receptor (MCP) glutamine deamidase CheD
MLDRNGYSIHACDVGGVNCRTLRLEISTGKVTINSPGVPAYQL